MIVFQVFSVAVIATILMSVFLYSLHFSKTINADMIGAVGSLITRKKEGSIPYGILVHLVVGIVSSTFYLSLWAHLGLTENFLFWGALFGFVQGMVVSLGLVGLVAEHHPLREYQKVGFKVALAHIFAHIVFGLGVGLATTGLEDNYQFMTSLIGIEHAIVFLH